MPLFGDATVQAIVSLIEQRHAVLGTALGAPAADASVRSDQPHALQRDVKLLIGVANGEFVRSDAMVRRVDLALQHVLDLLLGTALGTAAPFPDDFWQTEIGVLVSRARWWISAEDLITISNAAALAFGANTQANRMRIARAIDNGRLEWVPDPSVANPQHNRRVLRSQVERLGDLGDPPE